MVSLISNSKGLLHFTHAEIKQKIKNPKLFGLDNMQQYLCKFCNSILTANSSIIETFSIYDLYPSILLYRPPNTGKTTLCYLVFDKIKKEVTNEINFYSVHIGGLLDPDLGQSSRNIEQIFEI